MSLQGEHGMSLLRCERPLFSLKCDGSDPFPLRATSLTCGSRDKRTSTHHVQALCFRYPFPLFKAQRRGAEGEALSLFNVVCQCFSSESNCYDKVLFIPFLIGTCGPRVLTERKTVLTQSSW